MKNLPGPVAMARGSARIPAGARICTDFFILKSAKIRAAKHPRHQRSIILSFQITCYSN